MINNEAFPNAVELYDKELMTVRGRGKYSYNKSSREEGEEFLRSMLHKYFPDNKVVYVV
jgi:spore photoproduct lyase